MTAMDRADAVGDAIALHGSAGLAERGSWAGSGADTQLLNDHPALAVHRPNPRFNRLSPGEGAK